MAKAAVVMLLAAALCALSLAAPVVEQDEQPSELSIKHNCGPCEWYDSHRGRCVGGCSSDYICVPKPSCGPCQFHISHINTCISYCPPGFICQKGKCQRPPTPKPTPTPTPTPTPSPSPTPTCPTCLIYNSYYKRCTDLCPPSNSVCTNNTCYNF